MFANRLKLIKRLTFKLPNSIRRYISTLNSEAKIFQVNLSFRIVAFVGVVGMEHRTNLSLHTTGKGQVSKADYELEAIFNSQWAVQLMQTTK